MKFDGVSIKSSRKKAGSLLVVLLAISTSCEFEANQYCVGEISIFLDHKSRNHVEKLNRRGKSEDKNLSGTKCQMLGIETYL